MSGVVKAKDKDTGTPVALVTLCGTLAIVMLPYPARHSAMSTYGANFARLGIRAIGTTTLFAALDVLTGKLSANAFYQKHTNVEFVDSWTRWPTPIRTSNCMSFATTTPRTNTRT